MRKKSNYRPKGVIRDVMGWIKGGMTRMSANKNAMLVLKARNHGALRALVMGEATKADIDELVSAYNMTTTLAAMGIGEDLGLEIRRGLDALYAIASRGGRFICRAEEITALNLAMEVHDAQLEVATVAEVQEAIGIVARAYKMGAVRVVGSA